MAGSRNPKRSRAPSAPSEEELSLALLNIDGLKEKTEEIQYIFRKHKVHAMALCDTRIKRDEIVIQGLKIDKEDGSNENGRGVAVCYQDHIETRLRSDLMHPDVEIIWIEMIKIPGRPVLLGCCYRRPNKESDLVNIENTITQASLEMENKDIFLMGDFNINWDLNSEKKKMDLMSELGFTQIVKDATRVTIDSGTCIDHIYTNIPERCSKPESIATGSSDHHLVIVKVKMERSKKDDKLMAKWREDCEKVYDSLRLEEGLETLISERDEAKQAAIEKIHTFKEKKKAVKCFKKH